MFNQIIRRFVEDEKTVMASGTSETILYVHHRSAEGGVWSTPVLPGLPLSVPVEGSSPL